MDDDAPHFDLKISWFDVNVEDQGGLQIMLKRSRRRRGKVSIVLQVDAGPRV